MTAKKHAVSIGLAVLSTGIWLSACIVDTGFSLSYGRPVTSTTVYWWCFAPILVFFELMSASGDVPAKSKHGRHGMVILSLLALLLVCGLWRIGTALFYELFIWQITALLLSGLLVWLFSRSHPHLSLGSVPEFRRVCAAILAVYIPVLLSTLLYIAVLRPVSIGNIRPVGELEGGRYIGRITGDRGQTPLGVYFFADGDRWYYYDVLTGEPVQYNDPLKVP